MSGIPGTNVIAPIVPLDTEDQYPSHLAAYGKGGFRSVATTTDRDAIPSLRREAGMLVLVTADGKVWKLAADLTSWSEFSAGSSGTASTAWADITGKPTTFPPSAHTHVIADTSGLQAALDSKQMAGSYAASVHTHSAGQISGLATVATSGSYSDLSGLPTIPGAYTLPAATGSVLGGVKAGANVSVASDGTISVAAPTTTLAASAITGLAAVASSGAYSDLSGRPTIPSATTSASDLTAGTLSQARLDFVPIHPFLLMGG